jgi:hypothetical protein
MNNQAREKSGRESLSSKNAQGMRNGQETSPRAGHLLFITPQTNVTVTPSGGRAARAGRVCRKPPDASGASSSRAARADRWRRGQPRAATSASGAASGVRHHASGARVRQTGRNSEVSGPRPPSAGRTARVRRLQPDQQRHAKIHHAPDAAQ